MLQWVYIYYGVFISASNRSVTQHRQKQVKRPIVRSVQYPALKGPLIPLQTESPFSKTFWQNSGNLNAEGAIRALKMGLRQRVYKDKELVNNSVRTYNQLRPHHSCYMRTPEQMHKQDQIKIRSRSELIKKLTAPGRTLTRLVRTSQLTDGNCGILLFN